MEADNLASIEEMTKLLSLRLGIFSLADFELLNLVPHSLIELSLGATRSKLPDLGGLDRFRGMRKLFLEGHTKSIEVLSNLSELEDITLRSITTPDVGYLQPLTKLWSLDTKLGGIKSFSAIEGKDSLKYLELWQVKGLSDLTFISTLAGLQNLFLESLARVNMLPDFRPCGQLRRLVLSNLKSLMDFRPVEFAPVLEEFALSSGRCDPEDLIPALRNPSLRRISAGFGSIRKNDEFDALRMRFGKAEYEWDEFQYA
jgi:hypothetical protein